MADDTTREFRAASRAAEDYLSIEHDYRVGRNAVIISDVATDICESGEMILASLAHAFVMEYYEGGSIDRSPIGCIEKFAELALGALEGFSAYGARSAAVDSFLEARDEILDGHDEDLEYDPRSVLRFPDRDPLRDDEAADKDPAGCVEDHLRYVPDCVLLRLLDDVRLINAVHGDDPDDSLPDADPRALVAFFRAVHENDKEISSFAGDDPEDDEEETRIDLRPPADRGQGSGAAVPSEKEKRPSDGRIPRFTASNGSVRVVFVFGGDPDEDPQDRIRAQRPEAPGGLGLPR